ncbi:putative Nitrate reductase [Taphrina deformans PYCC 5710]|uniref:Nitrate reductase n=1 Tax=Taphrina deformans (strain PYCC 5710 / ATCC 11124 / CBS 356.35 / IMI 108563 / JCM 9778 / NBRC 8474) TaxID=1097556 RepID=R4XJJ6_TAPDE|nr:putative Nitrate reductase [Taphrina deformans PYCC 5710]|eukprot:CCG83520.1 putative Nitrate reductase [Taphrina deformans PYCC 5710]
MAKFTTFRDVVESRSTKLTTKDPVDATEQFIKYDQSWPINKEKDEQDKPTKKAKTDQSESSRLDSILQHLNTQHAFDTKKYISVPLLKKEEVTEDTRIYTFKHSLDSIDSFHLGIGQHIQCAFATKDGDIIERPYAITRPTGADKDDGTIDILVKVAFPSEKDPGGTVSNIMDCLNAERGDEMLIRGPEGPISYLGDGKFTIQVGEQETKEVQAKKVNFISGGTGMTPIYATIRAILETDDEKSQIQVRFMDCNKDEKDVLLKEKLDELAKNHDRFEVIHVLEKPEKSWKGETGLIDKEKIERHLFKPEEGTISLVCGPPPMMKSSKEGLLELGFEDERTFFHY